MTNKSGDNTVAVSDMSDMDILIQCCLKNKVNKTAVDELIVETRLRQFRCVEIGEHGRFEFTAYSHWPTAAHLPHRSSGEQGGQYFHFC